MGYSHLQEMYLSAIRNIIILLGLIWLGAMSCMHKEEDFSWMDDYDAIICLTYDDGMKTQYKNAIPQLNEFGIKGTFFINNVTDRESVGAWRQASSIGHELGNHTLFHPCPKSLGWPKEVTTDYYTVDLILEEIEIVNSILDVTELSSKSRSFAYPCNNMFIGDESFKDNLESSKLITYARSGHEDQVVIDRSEMSTDFMNVPSWVVSEGTDFLEMKSYVDKVVNQKGVGILQFHGIGGEWISVPKEEHYKLVQYLSEKNESILVTTFTNAMKYLESKGS